MYDWTQQILAVQDVDVRMAKLLEQIKSIPEKIEGSKLLYAAEAAAFSQADNELKALELEYRNCETQVSQLLAKKRDFQTKTTMIRNNDEYKAALLQIELCDKSVSDYEDRQLVLMEQIEIKKVEVEERQRAVEHGKKRADIEIADLKKFEESCRQKADEAANGLTELRAAVAPDVLKIYDRLRANAKISKVQPCVVPIEEGACGRCRMKITTQICQDAHKGKVVNCPSCSALLYREDC